MDLVLFLLNITFTEKQNNFYRRKRLSFVSHECFTETYAILIKRYLVKT
jgi:hypothetical protein